MEKKSLREEVGGAINAGSLRGKPLTLLNALAAGSDRLGSTLWRLRYGGDRQHQTRREAIFLITHKVHNNRHRIPSARLVLVVEQALKEWLDDACPTCRGQKFTGSEFGVVESVRTHCPQCYGKGKVRGIFRTPQETMLNAVSCQLCGGKGWKETPQVEAERVQACKTCDGSGHIDRGGQARAVALGITTRDYDRHWARPYEKALKIMRSVDIRTGRTVKSAMWDLTDAPGLEFTPENDVIEWMVSHGRRVRGL